MTTLHAPLKSLFVTHREDHDDILEPMLRRSGAKQDATRRVRAIKAMLRRGFTFLLEKPQSGIHQA